MKTVERKPNLRCAIYTRVSTDHGLEQEFNSLDNQREASEAYVKSQAHEGWKLLRDRYDDGGYSGGSMERPALARLLDDVRAKRIDVIVVYKVDRLTRSLADFAKLVGLFDAEGVSFVSVTQSFNTTTSIGRLTLNVLLSFAQFEREVTGERIRDKIAASKKRGIWMGGNVPLGYRAEDRALHIVEEHAVIVRNLFARYLDLGSVAKLQALLMAENFRLPHRANFAGRMTGGGSISRGHLYLVLSNPIYVGRLVHKDKIHEGRHAAIVDLATWDAVQVRLAEQAQHRTTSRRHHSDALLSGKLFDDRGNRMSPSFAAKGGRQWRYYVSQAILQNRKSDAGSLARVSAPAVETQVEDAIREYLAAKDRSMTDPRATSHANVKPIRDTAMSLDGAAARERAAGGDRGSAKNAALGDVPLDDASLSVGNTAAIRDAVDRLSISRTAITITLSDAVLGDKSRDRTITVRWTPPSTTRRREILQGDSETQHSQRPMRVKARLGLISALRDTHRWLDELLAEPSTTVETIAARERKTERSIRMTLSLAFLAPGIVEAGIEGKLPRGFGVTRLTDLPMAWSEQWQAIGIEAPPAH